jgi:hypothetical protein
MPVMPARPGMQTQQWALRWTGTEPLEKNLPKNLRGGYRLEAVEAECGHCGLGIPHQFLRGAFRMLTDWLMATDAIGRCARCNRLTRYTIRIATSIDGEPSVDETDKGARIRLTGKDGHASWHNVKYLLGDPPRVP